MQSTVLLNCQCVWLLQQEKILIKKYLNNARLLPWKACLLILEIQVPARHVLRCSHTVAKYIVFTLCRRASSGFSVQVYARKKIFELLSFPFPVCHAQ